MKIVKLLFVGIILMACDRLPDIRSNARMAYHFDEPATLWEESFPLGNGRIGLMPDGGIEKENIVLNEISMWSGSKQQTDNPAAQKSLGRIRELLFAGRNDEAQELMYDTFVCYGDGSGRGSGANKPYGSYQLLGNLILDFTYDAADDAQVSDYRRELDLEQALATLSFRKGKTEYSREVFTSFADDVAVIRLKVNNGRKLQCQIGMNRPERYAVKAGNSELEMRGRLYEGDAYKTKEQLEREEAMRNRTNDSDSIPAAEQKTVPGAEDGQGVRYASRVQVVLPNGGEVKAFNDTTLLVEEASEIILLVGMATDYFGKAVDAQIDSLLTAATGKSYETLKKEHIRAYQKFYHRVAVHLGRNARREAMPMNKRLEAFREDKDDPSLLALYYQFGRYLLISSTRPGLLPPNLQGLWCNTIQSPWNGDYHLNINLQMNLWPAETGNLSELHLPLIEWTKQQVESGRQTAKAFYNARGWVTHILGNVWEFTAPGEHPSWGATNTSAAWLCEHLYTHYLFTLDTAYLRDVYPVMRESALFFVDMLVEDPRSHYLVTAPTTSPENAYVMPNGKKVSVCAGSTMDNQILRELFSNTIQAARLLKTDEEFVQTLADYQARLMPTTIGPDGRIMEWLEPYEEAEPHHRHVSHLYGLYPANEISPEQTPDLAAAARKTLEARGDESTGWSMGWKVNFWARLHDGEHAYKLLADLLRPSLRKDMDMKHGGGTYPNLFCAHPPFQIDGNFGGCAGIAEMLVQSHNGYIEFLPALPTAWKNGEFKGLCVQGAGEVHAQWSDGELLHAGLKVKKGGTFRIKIPVSMPVLEVLLNGKAVSCPIVDGMIVMDLHAADELAVNMRKDS